MVLAPLEAVTAPWSVQPNIYVEEETTQAGGGKGFTVCPCKRPHEGERVTGQLSHSTHMRRQTHTTALGPPVKTAVRFPHHAGLCCKRGVAILSALRACENWSIANPGRVNKNVFFSRRNRIETVMDSVPLDALKQYCGMFEKMGPAAGAQFLNLGRLTELSLLVGDALSLR